MTSVLPTLHTAFLSAFSLADLDRMMRYELNRVREHYSTANGLRVIVDDILQIASEERWLDELVSGAVRFNPDNGQLLAAQQQLEQATTPVTIRHKSQTAAFSAETYPATTIAIHTATGGAIGWAVAGLILGAILGVNNDNLIGGLVSGAIGGLLCGFLGGGLAGLLTSATLRKIAPRFAVTQLRRLGIQWALVNLVAIVGGGMLGGVLAVQTLSSASNDANGFVAAASAIVGAFVAALIIMSLIILASIVGGATAAGWLIGRQLRLTDAGISRWQGFGISLSWMVSGVATVFGLLAIFTRVFG